MTCNTLWLAAHLWTLHAGSVPNSETFGAGLECNRQTFNVQAGVYDNSVGRLTVYTAVGHDWGSRFQFGLFGGLATGYLGPAVQPIAGARFGYQADRWRVQTILMPPSKSAPTALHLMVEFRL